MKTPNCALWDKDYADQWKARIKAEIEENYFADVANCLCHIMSKSRGRTNPKIVREMCEESLK